MSKLQIPDFDTCEDPDLRQTSVAPLNWDDDLPTLELQIPEELTARTGKTLATLQKELGFGYSTVKKGMAVFEMNIEVLPGETINQWKQRSADFLALLKENVSISLSPFLLEHTVDKYNMPWGGKIDLKIKNRVESLQAATGQTLLKVLTTPTQ